MFNLHSKCETERFNLQLELMKAKGRIIMAESEARQAKRLAEKAQEAEARSWATVQLLQAENQHLRELVELMRSENK